MSTIRPAWLLAGHIPETRLPFWVACWASWLPFLFYTAALARSSHNLVKSLASVLVGSIWQISESNCGGKEPLRTEVPRAVWGTEPQALGLGRS